MYGGPQQKAFIDTIGNLTGITHAADINGGGGNAVSITPFVCLRSCRVFIFANNSLILFLDHQLACRGP